MSGASFDWNIPPSPEEGAGFEGEVLDGSYRILGALGEGGMGTVLRALDLRANREVAVKLIKAELDERARARFLREGQLTAALEHPGIVRVHACGEHRGCPYLVYELVAGCRTLDDAMEGLGLEARVRLVRDAAEALGYAHAQGVVHRDVKPGNLLVDEEGRLRVADFGLAHMETSERLTRTGELLGTPLYMAPEQVQGGSPSPATDVWALGVILYEAATDGANPFESSTLTELMVRICTGQVRSPKLGRPELPDPLVELILQALQVDPSRRPADGRALAAALDAACDPAAAPGSRAVGLRSLLLLGAATHVAGSALALALGLPSRDAEPGPTTRPPEVAAVGSASPRPTQEPRAQPVAPFAEPVIVQEGLDPRLRRGRFVGDEHLMLHEPYWRGHLVELWRLAPVPVRVWSFATPYGARFYFGDEVDRCHVFVDARDAGDTPWLLLDQDPQSARPGALRAGDPARDVRLEPGTREVAVLRLPAGRLRVVLSVRGERVDVIERTADGQRTLLSVDEPETRGAFALSSDGALLALASLGDGDRLAVYEVQTGALLGRQAFLRTLHPEVAFSSSGRLVFATDLFVFVGEPRQPRALQPLLGAPSSVLSPERLEAALGAEQTHPGAKVDRVACLPGDRLASIAYSEESAQLNELRLWDLTQRRELEHAALLQQPRRSSWVAASPSGRWLATGGEGFFEVRDTGRLAD